MSFALPLVALLIHRLKHGFDPSPSGEEVGIKLGRWGTPINAVAVAWLLFEITNIAWPRDLGLAWYVEWGCLISMAVIAVVGVGVFGWLSAKGRITDAEPAGVDDLAPSRVAEAV